MRRTARGLAAGVKEVGVPGAASASLEADTLLRRTEPRTLETRREPTTFDPAPLKAAASASRLSEVREEAKGLEGSMLRRGGRPKLRLLARAPVAVSALPPEEFEWTRGGGSRCFLSRSQISARAKPEERSMSCTTATTAWESAQDTAPSRLCSSLLGQGERGDRLLLTLDAVDEVRATPVTAPQREAMRAAPPRDDPAPPLDDSSPS